jgi:hypothetical protein
MIKYKKWICAFYAMLFILSMVLPFVPTPAQADDPLAFLFPFLKPPLGYTIDDDKVVFDNDKIHFDASPHTLTASGWVTIKYYSKEAAEDLDVVFGFNDDLKVAKAQFLNPDAVRTEYDEEVSVKTATFAPSKVISSTAATKSFVSADVGDVSINFNYATVEAEIIDPMTGSKSTQSKKVAYDTVKDGVYTYKYIERVSVPKTVVKEDFDLVDAPVVSTALVSDGMDKWKSVYTGKRSALNATQQAKVWVDVPFRGLDKVSGKYVIGMKPSSLSISEAKSQGKLWIIDPWYNASWLYAKTITVTNAVANKQTKIVIGYNSSANGEDVDCNSHCQTDFDDLRFTGSDGTTLLDYWVQEVKADGASYNATVWVENDATPSTTLYMYYGNAGATAVDTSQNMGEATFPFFDTFDYVGAEAMTDKWQGDVDHCTVASSIATQTANGAAKHLTYAKTATPADDTAVVGRWWINNLDYNGFSIAQAAMTTHITTYHGSGYTNHVGWATTGSVWSNQAYTFEVYHVYELRRILTGTDTARGYVDGVQAGTGTTTNVPTAALYPMFYSETGNCVTKCDWVFIRKYSTTEQTFAYGAETNAPMVPSMTTTANATSIEETSATLSGNITDVGDVGEAVTERGFEYDTNSGAPYASNTHENGSWGTDGTTYSLSPTLSEGTLYFFRAYGINGVGTGYGSEYTLQTKPDPPFAFTATMVAGDNIDLAWTKGDGADTTYIRGKLGSAPATRADGTYSWSGAGASVTHATATADQHWYYIAWSEASDSGYYTTLSDAPDASVNSWTSPQFCGYTKSAGRGRDWATFEVELSASGAGETFNKVDINYGVTTAYGSTISRTGTWHSGDKVLLTARGLNPATAYHFEAVVYETLGTHTHTDDDTFATLGSPSMFEYLSTGGDGDSNRIASANWTYEVFTADDVAHMVTSVDLQLKRVGAPSTVTVSIRDANAGGTEPTGEDLTSITMDGDTLSTSYGWYKFTFTTIKSLEANHYYAIVVRALDGDYTSNYVLWQKDTGGGLAGAINGDSANGGISWTSGAGDQLFQVWGYPSLQVLNAKVFTSYITAGDWLVVAETENTYPPYYNDNADPSVYFYLQLVDVVTGKTEAAVPCRAWARQPLGIYISKDVADTLSWSGNYTARMYYSEAGDYQEYPLASSDWRGTDMTYLDQWMRVTAASMQDYYGVTLITSDLSKSLYSILNSEGGVLFARGIPAITEVRPDMFSEVGGAATPHTEKGFTKAYEGTRDWQNSFGGGMTNTIYAIAEAIGVDTTDTDKINTFVGFLWIIAYVVLLILVGADRIDGWASIALAIPFVLVGAYGGAVDMSYLFGVILFAVAIRIFNWVQP